MLASSRRRNESALRQFAHAALVWGVALSSGAVAACATKAGPLRLSRGVLVVHGGPGFDTGTSVAIDIKGDIWVAGSFSGRMRLESTRELVARQAGDGFVARYSSTGALRWAMAFGGPGTDLAEAVVAHPGGGVVIAGGCHDCELTLKKTANPTAVRVRGGFVARIADDGALRWVHTFPVAASNIAIHAASRAVLLAYSTHDSPQVKVLRVGATAQTPLAQVSAGRRIVLLDIATRSDGAFALLAGYLEHGGRGSQLVVAFDAKGRELWRSRVGDGQAGKIVYLESGELLAALQGSPPKRCRSAPCWRTDVARLDRRGAVVSRSAWSNAFVAGVGVLPDGSPILAGEMHHGGERRYFLAAVARNGAMARKLELTRANRSCIVRFAGQRLARHGDIRGIAVGRHGRIALTGTVVGPTTLGAHAVADSRCLDFFLWAARLEPR